MSGGRTVWRIHHRAVTESTNRDAIVGEAGDVFTADMQTAGRGRIGHRWLSPPGENLMLSAVIGVDDAPPEDVATLPLVVGLAVAEALESLLAARGATAEAADVRIKWPNDVLIGGRKIAGILCERRGGRVIAGLGVNVNQTVFAPEIAACATSMLLTLQRFAAFGVKPEAFAVATVRDAVLARLSYVLAQWRERGFSAVWPRISARDFLKGTTVSVRRTDDDTLPIEGHCAGVRADGALDVDGEAVFAGEAHVCDWRKGIGRGDGNDA